MGAEKAKNNYSLRGAIVNVNSGIPWAVKEGALYEVKVRRVINRPEWTVTERLRFAGLSNEGWTLWLPEDLFVGSRAIPLRLDEIASLREVAEVEA